MRPVALAAMEEYPGAYMRLLHNVFGVNRAAIYSFVLARDTPIYVYVYYIP